MKKNMLGWGLRLGAFALPVTLVTACGDSGFELDAPASASQANISNLTASFNDVLLNEGSGTAARITRLCVDSNTNTTIAVDWGDGSPDDLVTKTGGGFLQNTASCPGAGIFEVCGNSTACADIPHTYADDSDAATFAASITVTNAGGSNTFTQPGGIAVRNLAPTLTNLTQDTAANVEEGQPQIFSVVINDPGTAGTEIENVVFTITPPPTRAPGTAPNAEPDTITCTCLNDVLTCPGNLATGTCHGGTARVTSRFLDNGNYSVTAVITDEDALTATATIGPITIDNKSPVQPDIRLTGLGQNANGTSANLVSVPVSAASANPTKVLEGFNYAAAFILEDQGTDQLTWNWSFATGRATGTGAGSISNLTRPLLDNLTVTPSVAAALNDEVRFNDIGTDAQLDFLVADDDGNSNNAPHFVFVRDADPIISGFTASAAAVNEGSTLSYTLTATSGDFGSGLDALTRREWLVASGNPAACTALRATVGAINSSYDAATGRCFLGFNIGRTWDAARADCAGKGLALASIHSVADLNRANSLIGGGWNGLNDIAREGNFVNIDGSAFDFPYFGGGEPNDLGGEDCVQGSNDANCNSLFGYVCATTLADDLSNGVVANSPYAIDTGCGIADDTCTIRFLDDTTDSPHGISVRVRDEDSFTTSSGITATVNNVNPIFSSITLNGATFGPGLSINEAGTMAFEVEAFDPAVALDGIYTLTIDYGTTPAQVDVTTLTALGTGARFAAQSELVIDNDRCDPASSTTGGCLVRLTVCEVGDINCVTTAQTVNVNNVAPTVVALEPSAEALVEGVNFDLDGEFDDVAGANDDNFSATWSWSDGSTARTENRSVAFANRLTGADVVPTTQSFQNVPAAGLTAVAFRLAVTDEDGGATISAPITSNVRDNVPNVTITDLDFVGNDNNELATPILTVDVDPETPADLLSRLVVAWGDGTTSTLTAVAGAPGLNQFSEGGQTGIVVQKPAPYPDSDSDRSTVVTDAWRITVTLFDEEGGTVPNTAIPGRDPVESISAAVDNLAPIIVSLVPNDNPVIVSEGQAAAFIITTTDPSPADRLDLEFNLTVLWGDGSPPETFTQSSGSGVNRVFRAAHVYNNPSAAGGFPVTFTVNDREGLTDAETIAIEVVNIPPSITDLVTTGPVPEGTPVTVAALTDNRGADVLTYAFNFDTCVLPADAADFGVAPGAPNPSAVAANTYVDNGARTVCVRVCDDDGQPNSCDFASAAIVVDNANPVITAFNAPAAINEGGSVSLTATATDLGAANDPLTFTFDCTDNGASADDPTPSLVGANRTCAYPQSGVFNARVTVTDGDGGSVTQTTTIRVNNLAPSAPIVAAIAAVNEGTASVFSATSSDIGGDAIRFEYDFAFVSPIFTLDQVSSDGVASTRFATDGSKTIGVRACDAEGLCSGVTSATAVVNNVAPVIASVTAPSLVREGTAFTVSVDATDAGNDTLTYQFEFADVGGATPSGIGTNPTAFSANEATTATINEPGRMLVTVRVTDGSATVTQTVFVDVDSVPGQLVSFTANPQRVLESNTSLVTLTAIAEDTVGSAGTFDFTFDCDGDGQFDDGSVNDPAGGIASVPCIYGDNGSVLAAVRAVDADGNIDTRTVVVVVDNAAPTAVTLLASVSTLNEGGSVTFTAAGTDVTADQGSLAFEYDFDGNGVFEVRTGATATFAYGNQGSFAATVKACDKDGACTASTPVTITVNNATPVINRVVAPATVSVGTPLTVAVDATDVAADTLTYTFTFTDRDGVVTTVGPQASNVATAIPASSGTMTVGVSVTDGTATATSTPLSISVLNEAPRLTTFTTNPLVVNEGGGVTTLTAIASDLGGGALTTTFTCGGGTLAVTGATTATCTYATSGVKLVTVTVADRDGATDTRSQTLIVDNVAPATPVASVTTAGALLEGGVVAFTASSSDAGGDTFRFEYDFNNDGIFDALSTDGVASTIFAADGTKSVKVRACDTEGACSQTATVAVVIGNAAPVIAAVRAPTTSLVGAPVTVSVEATDAGNDPLTYAFSFASAGGDVVTVPAQSSPVATVTLTDASRYTVTVTVSDGTASAVNSAANVLVVELSVSVIASASDTSINEGETTDLSVTIPNGTGPFLVSFDVNADGDFADVAAGDRLNDACANDPCTLTGVRFPQNRAGDLAFRVLVQVVDRGQNDLTSTAIVAIDVLNVAPTLTVPANQTINEGATLAVSATSTDPGVQDTTTFALAAAPAGMTIDATTGAIAWTTTFRDVGTHTVTVSATDSDGASDTETFTVTVNIVDTNNNGISDGQERDLNNGQLFCADTASCDALEAADVDQDGVSDLDELLAGTNPNDSDAPRAPVVISPDNGIEVNTATPTLTVANASNPRGLELSYTFCIEATPADRCIDDVVEGDTTTSVVFDDGTALTEGGEFSWYAFASDRFVDGAESARGSFVVDAVNAAPGAPDALSPAATASFLEGSFPSLEARAVLDPDGDAVTYTFTVATDAALTAGAFTSVARDVPFFTIDRALVPGTYHWRATASDGVLSTNGAPSTFVIKAIDVNEAPTAPAIVSPSNEDIGATSATLTITAGTDPDGDTLTYEFEIADNAAFANADVSGAQAGLTFAVTGLAEDTAHFWRARSFDGVLYSDWSNATFVVDAVNGAPSGLALLSPTDGALLLAAPAAFTATEAVDPEGDALTYQVVVSANEDFSSPLVDVAATVVDGVVRLEAPADLAVEAGVTYFWRVTASDGTNDIVAAASFSIFDEGEDVSVGGGGCGCNANEPGDSAGVIAAALGLLALRRRRRKV